MVFKVILPHASDPVFTGEGRPVKRVDVHLGAYYRFAKPIAAYSNPAIKEGG
jgi:hypothetical protein